MTFTLGDVSDSQRGIGALICPGAPVPRLTAGPEDRRTQGAGRVLQGHGGVPGEP